MKIKMKMEYRKTTHEIVRTFLKEKRITKGITTRAAEILITGKDNGGGAFISRIETGSKQITIDTLEKFMIAYNCEVSFIER